MFSIECAKKIHENINSVCPKENPSIQRLLSIFDTLNNEAAKVKLENGTGDICDNHINSDFTLDYDPNSLYSIQFTKKERRS